MPDAAITVTDIPARLDALPWGRFHTLVVIALGVTWILDGLEVTLAGSVAGALQDRHTLGLTAADIGLASSGYLGGCVVGALGFGWLADRWGRRRLFFATLILYACASGATGMSWDFDSFAVCRFLTGAGIGGEYTAVNSTIQELVPGRVRGWTDLVINGSFWLGAALGAGGSLVLLDPAAYGPDVGWRLCFLIGAALAVPILFMRRWIPESPRWLLTHGDAAEAEKVVGRIEARMRATGAVVPERNGPRISLRPGPAVSVLDTARVLFRRFRQRSLVSLGLLAAQAFFYNAIFFTYPLVLMRFYGVAAPAVGRYILPFALGNALGPLLLGRWFDTRGRRCMIASTYVVSGLLLTVTALLFERNLLSDVTLTVAWTVTFFVASAAASSAYLTVSEVFPLEIRARVIGLFYATGTALGGVAAPALFGALIGRGSHEGVFFGYVLGAALMIGAGVAQWRWGVAAERRPLESVARPLSAID